MDILLLSLCSSCANIHIKLYCFIRWHWCAFKICIDRCNCI